MVDLTDSRFQRLPLCPCQYDPPTRGSSKSETICKLEASEQSSAAICSGLLLQTRPAQDNMYTSQIRSFNLLAQHTLWHPTVTTIVRRYTKHICHHFISTTNSTICDVAHHLCRTTSYAHNGSADMQMHKMTATYQHGSQALLMSSSNVTSAVIKENGGLCRCTSCLL